MPARESTTMSLLDQLALSPAPSTLSTDISDIDKQDTTFNHTGPIQIPNETHHTTTIEEYFSTTCHTLDLALAQFWATAATYDNGSGHCTHNSSNPDTTHGN